MTGRHWFTPDAKKSLGSRFRRARWKLARKRRECLRWILRVSPWVFVLRDPGNRIQRQAQTHRGIAGDEPKNIVAQEPGAGEPTWFIVVGDSLDRQRVAEDFAEALLEKACDPVAFE